jgi:hypothetical protein
MKFDLELRMVLHGAAGPITLATQRLTLEASINPVQEEPEPTQEGPDREDELNDPLNGHVRQEPHMGQFIAPGRGQSRGSSRPAHKLTESDIPLIFGMRESGLLQREIAERFGVAQPVVSDILNGKAWTHVTPT